MRTIQRTGDGVTGCRTPASGEPDDLRRRCAELELQVADHERTVQSLVESEERLRVLFERAPDGYYLCDLLGTFIDGNKAAEELIGHSREDLIGKNFLQLSLLRMADVPRAAKLLAMNAAQQSTGPDVFRLKRPDGTQIDVEIRTHPVTLDGRRVVLGMARDVTVRQRVEDDLRAQRTELETRVGERTAALLSANEMLTHQIAVLARTEQSLRVSEHRFRAMVAALPDLILRIARDGTLLDYEASESVPTFVAPEQFLGSTLRSTMPPEVAEAGMAGLERALESQRPQNIEYALEQDGVTHYYEARIVPIGDEEVITIIRDVTMQRDLAQRAQASRDIEKAGSVSGGVARDVNNLLQVIVGYGELARGQIPSDNESAQADLREVLDAAERGANLARKLAAFSSHTSLTMGPMQLDEFSQQLLPTLEGLLPDSTTLELQIEEAVPGITADGKAIETVLVNLVANASDAMPHGGTVGVTVRLASEHDIPTLGIPSGEAVAISVCDTGTGMDKIVRERVIEPFFTTKDPGIGIGLGMSEVHGLVRQHGGILDIQSEVGEGTTVTVYLPVVTEGAPVR